MKKVPKLRFPEFEGEWEEKKLGEIGEFFKGSTLSKANLSEEGKPCILYGELYTKYGEVIKEVVSKTNLESNKLVIGNKNDVLIPSSGESAIDIATASCLQSDGIFLGGDLNVIRAYKDNGVFISYQLNNSKRKEIAKLAQGASVTHLYNNQLIKFKIDIPQKKEQEKIASFFSLIDRKKEKQQQKVEALEEYKKGMMRKIFSQEIRFKDENGDSSNDWRKVKIGECFSERSERGFSNLELLAVTINNGITQRSAIGAKDNSSEDKSNYKLVKPEDIVYNSMRMWQGASGVSKFTGIVSPAYTVLIPRENICSDYFGYLFKTHKMIYEFKKYSQGLTSDTWNLKYPQIKDISIKVPSLSEQNSVCEFLKSIDQKILLEKEKLEYLNQWKKGLLQQMFV